MSLFPFVPPGVIIPATIAFVANTVDFVGRTVYTFSGHAIGTAAANRTVIVGVGGNANNRAISGVTIAGNPMTPVSGTANTAGTGTTEFFEFPLAAGTTADIVVTWSGAQQRCSIYVFEANGVGTSNDSAIDFNPNDVTLTVLEGGVVASIGINNDNRTNTWTGITEEFDDAATNIYGSGGSKASALGESLNITITYSGGVTASTAISSHAAWPPG